MIGFIFIVESVYWFPSFLQVKSICYPHVSRSFPNLSSWLYLRQSILALCSWHKVKQTNTNLVILYTSRGCGLDKNREKISYGNWDNPWFGLYPAVTGGFVQGDVKDWGECLSLHVTQRAAWLSESLWSYNLTQMHWHRILEKFWYVWSRGNVLFGYWGVPLDNLSARVCCVTIHPQTQWLPTTIIYVSDECGFDCGLADLGWFHQFLLGLLILLQVSCVSFP